MYKVFIIFNIYNREVTSIGAWEQNWQVDFVYQDTATQNINDKWRTISLQICNYKNI